MRKVISVLLIIVLVGTCVSCAFAHDDQNEHDKDLKQALFGNRDKQLVGEEKTAFQAIADAAAVTIDQFSPNDTLQWKKGTYDNLQNELSDLGVQTIGIDFKDLDLNIHVWDNVKNAEAKNITANSHRRFTHMGWKYKRYPNEEFWKRRKSVLLQTANEVLFTRKATFSRIPLLSGLIYQPSEQCEAFCAVVYYIHILGDHIEGDIPDKLTDLEPLIQYTSFSTPGIITELMEQLRVLFPNQTSTRVFSMLMQDLTDLRIEVEDNCGMWGSVDTVEKCRENQKYAKKLLEILATHLPLLLQREPFFADCFKP